MLNITTGQLEAWLAQYIWVFIRIGACFMAAPVFGAQFVPPRVRLFLGGAMTLIVAPLVTPPTITVFSLQGGLVAVHQIVIGVATGFALQLIFDALAMDFTTVNVRWDADCPVCGKEPTITELIDYEAFCGLTPGQAPPEAEHGVSTS